MLGTPTRHGTRKTPKRTRRRDGHKVGLLPIRTVRATETAGRRVLCIRSDDRRDLRGGFASVAADRSNEKFLPPTGRPPLGETVKCGRPSAVSVVGKSAPDPKRRYQCLLEARLRSTLRRRPALRRRRNAPTRRPGTFRKSFSDGV